MSSRTAVLCCSEEEAEKSDLASPAEEKPKENKTPPKDGPSPKTEAKKKAPNKAVKRKLGSESPKDAPSSKRVSTKSNAAEVRYTYLVLALPTESPIREVRQWTGNVDCCQSETLSRRPIYDGKTSDQLRMGS